MASRAVVFRPINKDDVSITPFEANTIFKTDETSYLTDGYVVRHGIHNVQTTPISASNLDADNARNPDGTYQTPTWKAIDHLFYRPETKNVPMHTMEHYNPRYTEKNLFYSCSVVAIPYVKHGENIKKTSVHVSFTGSDDYQLVDLYDDKYGNLRDHTINTGSFISQSKSIAYWGFNDEFRHFELNFGRLGVHTRGKTYKHIQNTNRINKDIVSTAHLVRYEPGIKTTGLGGITLGSEIVPNPTFASDTNWNKNSNWTIGSGVAASDGSSNGNLNYGSVPDGHQHSGSGITYSGSLEIKSLTSGTGYKVSVGQGTNFSDTFTTVGVHQFVIKSTLPYASHLYITPVGNAAGTIDNVHLSRINFPNSGIAAAFDSGSKAYIITPNNNKFNFRQDQDFAISFWCKLPPTQSDTGSTAYRTSGSNCIITKRGVEQELVRVNRKSNRKTFYRNTNIHRTRFPYDISVTNKNHPTYPAGKILFSRSNGIDTLEVTSSTCVTSSNDTWYHVMCSKSGSDLAMFVNGVWESGVTDKFHTADDNLMNPSHLMFGALDEDCNASLSGSIDEIRIFNTYLHSASAESLANNHWMSSSAYQTNVAGNVFYRSGQIVVSSPLPKYHYALQEGFDIEHKSSRTIYENEILCKVPMGECNVSMNPTLRKPKSELIQNQFTSSAWKPYITTIGLYDDNAQLLAVAKLARPVQKRDDVDMNFLIKWDY